jgi:hypothetical protein
MTRNDAIKKVAEALRMIQKISGRPVDEITEGTIPIGGLAGFDSLNGVEVAVIVGAMTGNRHRKRAHLGGMIGA